MVDKLQTADMSVSASLVHLPHPSLHPEPSLCLLEFSAQSGDYSAGTFQTEYSQRSGGWSMQVIDVNSKAVPLQVTTVKSILGDAGENFGMNMKLRKPVVQAAINDYLEAQKAGTDPYEAMGLEAPNPAASEVRRVQGRVIVVGAGPAGLAAALHLKVSARHHQAGMQSAAGASSELG